MKQTYKKTTQLKQVYDSFFKSPKTMKEVFVDTGILREFICWYCRDLRNSNSLYLIRRRKCTITGEIVNEYTTNEKFLPDFPKQLNIFKQVA